ncbi:MAG: hypothetical protein KG029_10785 [Bacteroidetes bacterium]|nr:hypothetical protein [Bacteroidota bacterium]
MAGKIDYKDPHRIARVVSLVDMQKPELNIGEFEGIMSWEDSRGPLVKTTNGKLIVSMVAIEDLEFYRDIPEYSDFMASTYLKD